LANDNNNNELVKRNAFSVYRALYQTSVRKPIESDEIGRMMELKRSGMAIQEIAEKFCVAFWAVGMLLACTVNQLIAVIWVEVFKTL
jgi:hypothetical protein